PSLVVLKLRPPTKSFCAMEVTCRTSAYACASQERGRNCETASGEGGSMVSRCPDHTGRVYARRRAAVSSAGSVRSRMPGRLATRLGLPDTQSTGTGATRLPVVALGARCG